MQGKEEEEKQGGQREVKQRLGVQQERSRQVLTEQQQASEENLPVSGGGADEVQLGAAEPGNVPVWAGGAAL